MSETLPTVRSTTNLFQGESLSKYLSQQRDFARRAVGEISSLETFPRKSLNFERRTASPFQRCSGVRRDSKSMKRQTP
jgi:hypothetical protein